MVYFCCLSVDDFIGGKIFMYLVTIWVLLISYFVLCSVELLNVCCEIVLAEDGLFHEVCNGVHSCFAGGAKDVVVFFSKLRCTFFICVAMGRTFRCLQTLYPPPSLAMYHYHTSSHFGCSLCIDFFLKV